MTGNASLRLRFDSNHRIDTALGGREAERLSGATLRLSLRPDPQPFHHERERKTTQLSPHGHGLVKSPCRAQACVQCAKRARIRCYVVQASCLGLYYATNNMRTRVPAAPTLT